MSENCKFQNFLTFSSFIVDDFAFVDFIWIDSLIRIVFFFWERNYKYFYHLLSIDLFCQNFQCRSHCFEIKIQSFNVLTQLIYLFFVNVNIYRWFALSKYFEFFSILNKHYQCWDHNNFFHIISWFFCISIFFLLL